MKLVLKLLQFVLQNLEFRKEIYLIFSDSIKENLEKVESEKTRLLIAIQHQKVVEKEAETERKRETIEALKRSEVSLIHMQKEIETKLSKQKIRAIEDQMEKDTVKAQTDSIFYKK